MSKKDLRVAPPELGTLTGAEADAFFHGVNTVIWGFPAVLFEDFMRARTLPDAEARTGNPRSLVNQFGRMRQLRGPEFKQIATPNNDTLMIQAFCDVRREPLILSVPPVDARRYYVVQLWDANGDTFDYIGSRTTGLAAGHFALTGPDWEGTLPEGVQRVRCPYNAFVCWGRVGVDGAADLDAARAVQDGIRLGPLSRFGRGDFDEPDAAWSEQRVAYQPPEDLDEALQFFDKLARANRFVPPKPAQDAVFVDALSQIGFVDSGTRFDAGRLSEAQKNGLRKAWQQAHHLMDLRSASEGAVVNGWRWSPRSGIMGVDYLWRAAFAKWFTGGNAPEEAIYMICQRGPQGAPLDGTKAWRIRFEPGALPPAKAFWSISMYQSQDGAFTPNPIDRYSIGDRTQGLEMASDGSLSIALQHTAPAEGTANWLPTPAGPFYLVLRMYVPDDSLQQGRWAPPAISA